MTKLSVITLSYNTKDLILECLESVASQYKSALEKKLNDFASAYEKESDTKGSNGNVNNIQKAIATLSDRSKKDLESQMFKVMTAVNLDVPTTRLVGELSGGRGAEAQAIVIHPRGRFGRIAGAGSRSV